MPQLNLFGKGRTLRYAITFTCEMGFIFFGYDQGVMSGLVTNKNFVEVVGHPDASTEGIMLSIYNLGCFTGCILNFLLGDYFGRRRAIWISMLWIMIGATLQTTTFSLTQLMVGRFITGIGTGVESSTVPLYQAELCEAQKRGRLVCSEMTFLGVGLVISAFFDYGMVHVDNPLGWRLPIACQLIFCLIVSVMVFGLPESPRYLFRRGHHDEAVKVLCDIYNADEDDEKVVKEHQGILQALRLEHAGNEYSWRKVFKRDDVQTGKRVLLAFGVQFMNQMGGINLAVYYMPTVLEKSVGVSQQMAILLGSLINCMFLLGSFVPTLLADKLGRRKPMIWGSLGCGVSMMVVGILLSFNDSSIGRSTSVASVAFFFTFMLIYGMSMASVPWCYVPEILPLHARARGTATAISCNWICNFFIVMITPTLISQLQWKAYLIFMCLNLAFIPLLYFFYPETANLTLEEIDLLYAEPGTSPRVVADRFQKQMTETKQGIMESKIAEAKPCVVMQEVLKD
ncbi:general substrate transporter [Lipomyces doorenjongii]